MPTDKARSRIIYAIGCLGLLAIAGCSRPEPLPEITQVPGFELQDQSGASFARDTLAGRVWIANFMFTSCPTICPRLTEQMASLQQALAPQQGWHLVSFSVDPRNDTPERLHAYAREHGADLKTWSFATGPLDAVRDVVVQGFKQALQHVPATNDTPADILHGSHFVLVDRKGMIRGYYRSDDEGQARLLKDARALLKEAS